MGITPAQFHFAKYGRNIAPILTIAEKNAAITRQTNFLSLKTIFNPSIYFSFLGGI